MPVKNKSNSDLRHLLRPSCCKQCRATPRPPRSCGKFFLWASTSKAFGDYEPDPNDIVLLVKANLSSTRLTQKPVVYVPHSVAAECFTRFNDQPVSVAPRKAISDKEKKELLKTCETLRHPICKVNSLSCLSVFISL